MDYQFIYPWFLWEWLLALFWALEDDFWLLLVLREPSLICVLLPILDWDGLLKSVNACGNKLGWLP